MSDKPILFSTPMVKAILAGEKSMTRRVLKEQPKEGYTFEGDITELGFAMFELPIRTFNGVPVVSECYGIKLPYQVGDRLWCKETWCVAKEFDHLPPSKLPENIVIHYLADGEKQGWCGRTRSLRFMPKRFSRITLEVTGVKVERVQGISAEDAIAEGLTLDQGLWGLREWEYGFNTPCEAFWHLWDLINKKRGFGVEQNPWVGAYTFRREK